MSTLLLSFLAVNAAFAPEQLTSGDTTGVRTRLAILQLAAAGVPDEYATGLTETVATTLAQTGAFDTVSPKQISSLLAYEKRKELMGSCSDENCYQQIAQIVKADHLVAGSIAKVADQLVLNLILLETKGGKAIHRVDRKSSSAAELMEQIKDAAIVVLQPVLSQRTGFLKIACDELGANVWVDDQQRIEGVNQVIRLAAGPHRLRVGLDGFYSTASDLKIEQGKVAVERVSLIPAKETIESYESRADLMRYGAYATGALAIAAGVAGAIFYTNASDDYDAAQAYSRQSDLARSAQGISALTEADQQVSDFSTGQALYLSALGTAVASGAISLYLFIAGDDPDRYDQYRSVSE